MKGRGGDMDMPMGQSTLGEMLPFFIFIVVCLLLIVFCIIMIINTSKVRNRNIQEINRLKNEGMTHTAIFKHVNGLPIAENSFCTIRAFPDRIEFKTDTMSINLEKEKITDVCITTDTDIQKQYVSSVGGAVGGAVLFGPIGAIIGGRAKQKKIKTVFSYLIFSYKKEEEIKFIGFDVTNQQVKAYKFVGEFKKTGKITTVDL